MKKLIIVLLVTLAGCKKNDIDRSPLMLTSDDSLVRSAKSFFNSLEDTQGLEISQVLQLPRRSSRKVNWDLASVVFLPTGKGVLIPVSYDTNFYMTSTLAPLKVFEANKVTKLLIYSDKSRNYAEVLSFFPDSNYSAGKQFTGITLVDDWNNHPISRFKFERGGNILCAQPDTDPSSPSQSDPVQDYSIITVYTCVTIYGYNYSATDPDDGYYWSQSGGCSYQTYILNQSFSSGLSSTGGGAYASLGTGGGGIASVNNFTILSASNAIANISDYIKCFTNIPGSGNSYQVSVCVDQPVPGTRQPWGFNSASGSSATGPVNIGHTFLILIQNASGNITKRNIGFYPAVAVSPLSPSGKGMINNDDQHGYSVSLTLTLTASQFYSILSFLEFNSADTYNLNSFNCTSFAINALAAAGINLPNTRGTWLDGGGNDPGDLGQDIRSMKLSAGSTESTQYNYHPNLGTCN